MGYSLRLEGDVRGLMARLKKFENIDKAGISSALSEVVRSSTMERFKAQKDPDEKKWVPSIRAQSEGGVTLTQTAGLKNSIKSKSNASGFAVGTNKVYARTHQFGEPGRTIRAKTSKGLVFQVNGMWVRTKQVRLKIPARRYLGLSEDDVKEIKATLEQELEG